MQQSEGSLISIAQRKILGLDGIIHRPVVRYATCSAHAFVSILQHAIICARWSKGMIAEHSPSLDRVTIQTSSASRHEA
ncbi:MAG: hypothetical protein AB7O04_11960 [Hyphomonadaceae bacterium]